MGATSKKARKIRTASEFDLARLTAAIRPPKLSTGVYAWGLDEIRNARDAQRLGRFRLPVALADAMRTDDGLFTAWLNRLAPQRGLPVQLDAANDSARAGRIRDEGEALFGPRGIGIDPATLADINSDLANHAIAIGYNVPSPRPDGSRVDVEMLPWPLEEVEWRPFEQQLFTRIDEGGAMVPIVHGDGRWTVFSKHKREPWKKDAAVLPGGLVWGARAFASRDWSKGSRSIGNAKVVGTMPEGMPLQDAGALTPDAAAFLALLRDIASDDSPVGVKPAGAALEYITNNSTAWQIYKELVLAKDRAAAMIYIGQEFRNASDSQRLSAAQLFGVRNDVVEGDLRCIERGILQGVIEPWCAWNFGDSSLAPSRLYLMPDADEDARRDALAKQNDAFNKAIKDYRENGFDVTPDFVTALAKQYGVKPPALKVSSAVPGAPQGAPTGPTAGPVTPPPPVAPAAAPPLP